MTTQVLDQTPRNQFVATNLQTIFPYNFQLFAEADITVNASGTPTNLVLNVDYTVSGVGNINGGNITLLGGGAATGEIVTLYRTQGFDRETDYQASGDFLAETVNDDFNRMILMLQQNREELDRSVKFDVDDVVANLPIKLPVPVAGLFLKWNTSLNALVNSTVPAVIVSTTEFSLVSDMVAATNLEIGNVIQTLGYTTVGDGGDNIYQIVAAGTGTDDGGSFIDLDTLQAQAVFPGSRFTVEQFGADPTLANNSTRIQAAVDYVASLTAGGALGGLGEYTYTTTINMKLGVSLVGQGDQSFKLIANNCDGLAYEFTSTFGVHLLRNVYLQGINGTTRIGIRNKTSLDDADELYGFTMENVLVTDFNVGLHGRHFRNLTIDNCWIQDVNRGIELIGKNLVVYITKTKVNLGSGNGAGLKQGIELDLFNFTGGTGNVGPEGVQGNNNQFFGFDIGAVLTFANVVNVIENDFSCLVEGITFSTVQAGLNIKDNIVEMKTSAASIGIRGRGLASPISTQVNIEGNGILGTNTTTGLIGIQINGAGNQNQNHLNIVRNNIDGCDINDILLNNAGLTNIENNRCLSTAPTDSIKIANVILRPVYINRNHCLKLITPNLAEVLNGDVLVGQNVESDTTLIWGDEDIESIASASNITLGLGVSRTYFINGTNTITSITATGFKGKRVLLSFTGILTVTDGSNLKLAGNFVTSDQDTLGLYSPDGTNWQEISRSAN